MSFKQTTIAIDSYFKQNKHAIVVLPGFVATTAKGEVSTYSAVARAIGYPKAYRAVGKEA